MRPLPGTKYVIVEKPESMLGKGVHVEGWAFAAILILKEITPDGWKILVTPKTGRIYRTKNRLWYTYKNMPEQEPVISVRELDKILGI